MIIGVPHERKAGEQRVAITPEGVHELCASGHTVVVQAGAGQGSGIIDADFARAGAEVVARDEDVFVQADIVCKVKEPLEKELELMRRGQVLFTFLHVAAYPRIGEALLASGVTAIGYETVRLPSGRLPLLAPMSAIAGRLAVQMGTHFLERPAGGRGVLPGGIAGVAPAEVVVLGAGSAGTNAARVASGMDAQVTVLDRDAERLARIDELALRRATTIAATRAAVRERVQNADLVIGAVLVPGHAAPEVVSADTVGEMRPGSVIVDLSIDQGGCIETSHETTHDDPTYTERGVLHCAVGNMPAAVPLTSTWALTNATLPYLLRLADAGLADAVADDPALAAGVQFYDHEVTSPGVAAALGRTVTPLELILPRR